MAEINPTKLQKPLKDKEGSFYPLTTYDQIIMPDNSRWNGKISEAEGTVKSVANRQPDENGNVDLVASDIGAIPVGSNIDANTFNGMSFEDLKKAILSEAVYQ